MSKDELSVLFRSLMGLVNNAEFLGKPAGTVIAVRSVIDDERGSGVAIQARGME